MAHLDLVRLFLDIATKKKWEVHHMHMKTTFLNGEVGEAVYVAQPAGIASSPMLSKVLRLHKALYGLHQALRAWNTKLDSVLVTLGITRSPSEHDLYTCGEDVEQLLLGVYVDDLIPIGACTNIISKFKEKMSCKFCTCDLGLHKLYLGIEVKQAPQVITL